MSAYLDYQGGESLYTGDVGPQNDGTNVSPGAAAMPQPVDAGGGPPANYSAAILDIFKFGVGAYNQNKAQQSMIDLRRWEATNAGLMQQGQSAAIYGGQGQMGILTIAAIGIVLLLVLKQG